MAVYCMSDLHGQIVAFHEMLKRIAFSPEDTLYIIGDVVDRGPSGIRLLQEIMHMPNVTLLLGNHELMMREYLQPNATEIQIRRWNRNRNAPTLKAFRKLNEEDQQEILRYLWSLPDCLEVTVSGTRYFLVHGLPGADTHDAVWGRPTGKNFPNPLPDRRLIIGHTPVPSVLCYSDQEEEAYLQSLEEAGEHVSILHADGFIDIDCGCGYPYYCCALSCLRLEDLAEFYIPVYTDLSYDRR